MNERSFDPVALDPSDFARLASYQKAHRCSFAEAALALGFMDRSELGDLLQSRERREPTVVDELPPSQTLSFGRRVGNDAARLGGSVPRVFKGLSAEYLETSRPAPDLIVAREPFHPRSEAMRSLRTALLPQLPADEGVALVVASSDREDGRSRLAAELALSLSQIEQPTLLLDADLRAPTQHRLFGIDRRDTLANVLVDNRMPRPQGVDGFRFLHVMPAGERVSNPLEMLTQRNFAQLLALATRHYRFVVIDTPPLSLYSDALAVIQSANRVLYVTRSGHTDLSGSRQALGRIGSVGTVLGSVLNRF